MRKYKPNSSQLSLMQPSRRSELEFHFFSNQSCRNIISRNQLFLGSICFKKNNSQKKILTKLFLLGSIYLHEYLTRKHEENFRQSKKEERNFLWTTKSHYSPERVFASETNEAYISP